jgi:hypothetical protein
MLSTAGIGRVVAATPTAPRSGPDAPREAGYDGPLSIENEDYSLDQREPVTLAVGALRRGRSPYSVAGRIGRWARLEPCPAFS